MKNLKIKNFLNYQKEKFIIRVEYMDSKALCLALGYFENIELLNQYKKEELEEAKDKYKSLQKKRG